MSATIVKLGSALTTPNNIKVKTDVLDYPETLILHDLSRQSCYPAQANPLAGGAELVNLATTGGLTAEGFRAITGNTPGYSVASKSLTFPVSSGRMRFGAEGNPYPLLGIGGQTTDLLVLVWVRTHSTDAVPRTILSHSSTAAGTSFQKLQFLFSYGYVANVMDFYAFGLGLNNTAIPDNTWTQIALYARCDTYNSKSGVARIYKNNVSVLERTAGIPTTFLATDATIPIELSTGNGNFDLGRIVIMKGLDASGLNPDVLVAQDYVYGHTIWP